MNKLITEEKFKDCPPEKTVQNIKDCLKKIGLEVEDTVVDADVGDCFSVHVKPTNEAFIFSNGKGVTPELAKASGYAEFIERLQCGLFLYKYQSINRDKEICLHTYAPDGKYMTEQELIDNGEWMDHIIATYGDKLTRKKLAEQCKMYACTDDDKILTLPFYSLFEDKYVYLPAGYVEHMYTANGCCAGNTRDEAFVHALAEILERNATVHFFKGEKAAPVIPNEIVNQYPIPKRILESVKSKGDFEITVYDFSQGSGYPVVGTLLINRDTQDYALNVSADPVLEIALSRGLTEILQGKKLNYFSSRKSDKPFFEDSSLTVSHNLINQHETNSGLLGVKFFTESPSEDDVSTFADNSNKTNSELLSYALNLFKGIGKPVYVRNYSFLGFPTYKFVVPGFSETRGFWFTEDIQEYGLGDILAKVLRNPANANIADLNFALIYFAKIQGVLSRKDSFSRLAGLNITGKFTNVLLYSSVSYAAYKLGRYLEASRYLKKLLSENYTENEPLSLSERRYLQILCKYLDLAAKKTPPEKIRIMLNKFFDKDTVSLLYQKIERCENLYEGFLLECDTKNCEKCAQNSICTYNKVKDIIKRAGEYYNKFTDGQNKENFAF